MYSPRGAQQETLDKNQFARRFVMQVLLSPPFCAGLVSIAGTIPYASLSMCLPLHQHYSQGHSKIYHGLLGISWKNAKKDLLI